MGYGVIGVTLVAIVATSIAQGCRSRFNQRESALQVFHDDRRHVTCWGLAARQGISCLPDRALGEAR